MVGRLLSPNSFPILSGSGLSSISASAPSDWLVSALLSCERARLGMFRSSTLELEVSSSAWPVHS
jgi:hypothetical protein